MHCFGCGYNLAGLQGPCCPECSRAFDPNDVRTFIPRTPRFFPSPSAAKWIRRGHTVIVLCPIYVLLAGHLAYWFAWLRLGRRPWPPDHGSDGLIESSLWAIFGICILLSVPSLVISVALSFYSYPPCPPRMGRVYLRLALSIACLPVAFAFARLDPFWAMNWMFD